MGTTSSPIPIAGNQSFSNVSNVSTQFSHLDVDNFKSAQADLENTTIIKELTVANLTASTGNITNITSTTITCGTLMPNTLNVTGTATVVNENITNKLTIRGAPASQVNARTEVLTNITTLNLLSNYDYSLSVGSFTTTPSTAILPATAMFGDRIKIQYLNGVTTATDHTLVIHVSDNSTFKSVSDLTTPIRPNRREYHVPTNELDVCFNKNNGTDLLRTTLTLISSQNAGGASGSVIDCIYMPDTATSTTGKWLVSAVSARNGTSTSVANSAFS